jgi:hypothetical protein
LLFFSPGPADKIVAEVISPTGAVMADFITGYSFDEKYISIYNLIIISF